MEATRERETTGLLDKILPPRLEDAGLEDCALPPDSIHEAFLKAASAVKSRAANIFHSDDEDEVERGCLDDPFPDKGKCSSDVLVSPPCPDMSDAVVVGGGSPDPTSDAVEVCVKEKGCGKEVEEGKDMVIVGGDGGEAADGKGCLDDELKGLKIKGEEKKKKNQNQEDDDEREKEKPILEPVASAVNNGLMQSGGSMQILKKSFKFKTFELAGNCILQERQRCYLHDRCHLGPDKESPVVSNSSASNQSIQFDFQFEDSLPNMVPDMGAGIPSACVTNRGPI
ncbi:hypothetical protein Gotri_009939 [Gossypium trilobum]|uniref:Uncharacterized protein n=1 Tax=Gossypium trilobum TaxID=34281 RepID=A0A7J9ENW3_9ROSI|nr:hypothetical protein [Gossypium trilobum]